MIRNEVMSIVDEDMLLDKPRPGEPHYIRQPLDIDIVGVDYEDAKVNAMAMFNVVTDSLLNSGQLDKTEEIAIAAQEAFGKDISILTTLINVALKQGDKEKSEKYINQALELDPENKELYYILGTSYIELKENEITIIDLELKLVDNNQITFKVNCGKGTYIRSLANDIGKALNSGGHLIELRRTRSGNFTTSDAKSIEEWVEIINNTEVSEEMS